ncbi:nucleoside monophosphate kinase [Dactylosporangium sp. NBC_01737]|uniref:adenylate kinase family protein n=1 Tax=Dactylosporangium sp. NBC_01737 TaxID=2975959 RepID=UPI002E12AAF6|nr:nucleoside monophosphate kinase [Dactylosporangium sp. NBC_01737]
MRRLGVLGVPGSDRETVAEAIAARLAVPLITMRDVIQAEFRAGTAAAAEADRCMRSGNLVPEDVTLSMVLTRLGQDDARGGFVLDNLPGPVFPAAKLDAALAGRGMPLDRVADVVLSDDDVIRRLCGRRVCRGCGRSWHVEFDPPAVPARCDRCGGELFQREDDTPHTVAVKLRIFRSAVTPTVEHYRSRGLLVSVDATLPTGEIAEAATC